MTEQLYNSRVINTFIKFIKNRYSYVDVNELLKYSNMEPYQVEDEGHWFTQEQVNLFHDRLVKLTGNEHIARDSGRYAASPDAIGVLRQYVLSMASPKLTYELIGKVATNFTHDAVYKSKSVAGNKVELTVTPKEGVNEKPFQCENRIGHMEAVPLLFGQKNFADIEHPECIFKGDKVCRYIISWQSTPSDFMKRVRNSSLLALSLACISGLIIYPRFTISALIPVSAVAILVISLIVKQLEKKELVAALGHVRGSVDQLMEQINTNYRNALVVKDIGHALSKQMSTEDILESFVKVLQKRLDFGRGMIMLANPEKSILYFRTGFGYTQDQYALLKNTTFHLDNKESRGVFEHAFHEQKPFLINNVEHMTNSLPARSLQFVKDIGTKSFICCPIIYEGESVGVLAVDNLNVKRQLVQSDLNLLMGIAPEIGISIHNSNLIAEKAFNERLSILGSTAAALAHEIRNPLAAIKTFAQLLPEKRHDDEFYASFNAIVPPEIERINRLITQLLEFAKTPRPESAMRIMSLAAPLKECSSLLSEQLRKAGITFNTYFRNSDIYIMGDADQLKQAYLNIMTNSQQAMHLGGTLDVILESSSVGAEITIADNGCGIKEDALTEIFNPFFTTKETGTGLGLTISKKILEEHGAKIVITSESGQGTTFKISFPSHCLLIAPDNVDNAADVTQLPLY